ncbi:tetratricopeptide repeat protein, partial [Escherichia coli]
NYSFYFNKGIVYQKMQAYDKAMPCFEKSILCYPTHQSSHLQLGITYLKQKYYIPGVLALNYAVMISPSTDKALTALGILNDIYVNGFDSYNTDNTFKESDA